jgi:hypothetical protein
MITDTQIHKKIGKLNNNFKLEVVDFIDFMLKKQEHSESIQKTPVFGCAKGRFQMKNDFDTPLTDFNEYMQ